MNKIAYLASLATGIILLVFGLNARSSIASQAKEAISGTPTDNSIWLIVLGVIGVIIGGLGILFRGSSK
jgi:divalent metal cation (Fe/Co/Zn/Cd) transporter